MDNGRILFITVLTIVMVITYLLYCLYNGITADSIRKMLNNEDYGEKNANIVFGGAVWCLFIYVICLVLHGFVTYMQLL